jgi:hypothetical protein
MSASLTDLIPVDGVFGTPKSDDEPYFHTGHDRAMVVPPGFVELVKLALSKIPRAML